jgi:DNA-binding LytR/AlgR family response regulator
MYNVLIIEDEKPALESLRQELALIDANIQISAATESVAESIAWLQEHKMPDLIFMDIQLTDGLSFNIFEAVKITCPVIFTTSYNDYMMKAFEYNGIDYLLKPIDREKLVHALNKYKALQHYFLENYRSLLDFLNNQEKKRSRILVKRGIEYQSIRTENIVYFFTEHKLVFLVDKENKKFMADVSNLTELESELDKEAFYRANRKFIVNVNYIKKFKPLEKSKLSVELTLPLDEEIIVSQENASNFKRWVSGV